MKRSSFKDRSDAECDGNIPGVYPNRWSPFALLVYGTVIALRAPEILWPGRFWAEEGAYYFMRYSRPVQWSWFFSSELGYFSLLNKIAAFLAGRVVPLTFAPLVTVAFSFMVMMLPAWIWLFSRKPMSDKSPRVYAFLALILLVQPNQEVWLNTVNSQFFLCISTAIILVTDSSRRAPPWVRIPALVLGGLTGVVSALLTPFFWVEYGISGKTEKLREALWLSAAALIQVLFVLLSGGRESGWHFAALPGVLFVKQWILPLFGESAVEALSGFITRHQLHRSMLSGTVALIPYVIVAWGLARRGRRQSVLLFCASVFIAVVSFIKSSESQTGDMILLHFLPMGGGRYYFAPNVLLYCALIIPQATVPAGFKGWSRLDRLAWLLAGLAICTGSIDYLTGRSRHSSFFTGPSWSEQVKTWEASDRDTLEIWPRPWRITVPKPKKAVCRPMIQQMVEQLGN